MHSSFLLECGGRRIGRDFGIWETGAESRLGGISSRWSLCIAGFLTEHQDPSTVTVRPDGRRLVVLILVNCAIDHRSHLATVNISENHYVLADLLRFDITNRPIRVSPLLDILHGCSLVTASV